MTTAGPPIHDWQQHPAQPGGGERPGGPPRQQWQNPRRQYQQQLPQQPPQQPPGLHQPPPAYGRPPQQGPRFDQPRYPGQQQYPGQAQYLGQAQHPGQQQYPGQMPRPGQAQYAGQQQYPGQPAGARAKVKPDKLVWIIALVTGFLLNAALWTPVARQTVSYGGYSESQSLMPISGGPVIFTMATIAGVLSLALGIMGLVVLAGKKNPRKTIGICAVAGGALATIIPPAFPPLAQSHAEAEVGGLADYNQIAYIGTTWVALALGLVVLGLGAWALMLKAKER